MNLPDRLEILIITLSDRASRGEYEDLSGPRIRQMVTDYFNSENMEASVQLELIPDDAGILRSKLEIASMRHNIIFTTGGTGIGPRDITVETVKPLLDKEIPGIMEFIRIKYGSVKPNALLSRGVAGVMGKSLIYTLPGSVRAVEEYMTEILKTLKHLIYMQYGIDNHQKH
ncbi:MAG: MogA/MoaB family molybdenum cofactor biosynthesis protein [Bacteroidia bacterium]|nr:MogA/MoaB family molybdenum cofactor biosynthesis protein [Bacteroidia bacterium]